MLKSRKNSMTPRHTKKKTKKNKAIIKSNKVIKTRK